MACRLAAAWPPAALRATPAVPRGAQYLGSALLGPQGRPWTPRGSLRVESKKGFGESQGSEIGSELPVVKTPADEDFAFEKRLAALRMATPEKKRMQEEKELRPLDYDAPIEEKTSSNNLAFGVGGGIAAVALLAIFLFSDILPDSGPRPVPRVQQNPELQLSPQEKATLELQVERFESILKSNPDDTDALEALAVSFAELGKFDKAADLLLSLTQKFPTNVEAIRLLAEVRAAEGQYEASAEEYRRAIRTSPEESLDLLQGLTEVLISSGRPDEAVGELLAAKARFRLRVQTLEAGEDTERSQGLDVVQTDLLLGRAYAAGDDLEKALQIYSGLISSRPEDFRGYLAKGVLLKNQKGKESEAVQLFAQARYLAPENAKGLVDKVAARRS